MELAYEAMQLFIDQVEVGERKSNKTYNSFKAILALSDSASSKTLGNTCTNGTRENVRDVVFWGNGDTFKLISKASSKAEGWMKSTKAMEIVGAGCVVQVTTQQGDNVAEALTFVPNVHIETEAVDGKVSSRKLIAN